ncbi:FkbM family methyltransferase [Rhodoplanes serenus]|uniref:FkbM family methyltransferase n=1 Tax=Rhodoplanes serenus TaxID=200615 RepID=A0A9X4XL74_9BRAD|nr:FkbM family methyltransferase [Rhodoplanes serenus]MTW16194.1 FkbM family methyltransferase [Rhodoplanes serenus]
MVDLSYTQNLEDYHLWLAFAGQATGTYIDIGAGHPVADNVSFWFYERGWQGLVIEPQADLLALYERLRPRDRRVCALVGALDGEAAFHRVDRLHGFSTTVADHARRAAAFGAAVSVERRPMTTLASLCAAEGITAIDFLKIDVEGGEADVLAGNDWTRLRPKVVLVEAVAPVTGEPTWADWEPALIAAGYRFALFDTLNRFYVAEEHPDVFARLPRERADWHAVRHMYEIGRAPENPAHPDHALARTLARGFFAALPWLDDDVLSAILARGLAGRSDAAAILAALPDRTSEAFRFALGRIACGYDGGQIHDD